MPLTEEDIVFFRAKTITDDDTNGGGFDETSVVVSNVKYNLFPRVSYHERINGFTRYRFLYMANRNPDNEIAYNAMYCLIKPSNGGDRFYVRPCNLTDTQADVKNITEWMGCGVLYQNTYYGNNIISVEFESNDYHIPNNALLYITDGTKSEWIRTSRRQQQLLAQANGTNKNFTLTYYGYANLERNTWQITHILNGRIIESNIDNNGVITGENIVNATISYTGNYEKTITVEFSTPPDANTNVSASGELSCYYRYNNIYYISLATNLSKLFQAYSTYVGVCLELGDLKTEIKNVQKNSANGNFDRTKIQLNNVGTINDTYTITFTSATNFTCSGANSGTLAQGTINANYAPVNPRTNTPYFIIPTNAWSGAFQSGDSIQFTTVPAVKALVLKEVIPPGTLREPNNVVEAMWFVE